MDGAPWVFETSARLSGGSSTRAPTLVEFGASPWPGLVAAWQGVVTFAVQPEPDEFRLLDLGTGEALRRRVSGPLRLAGGMERVGRSRLLGLDHLGPGEVSWVELDLESGQRSPAAPSATRLSDPQLIDCRPRP